MQTESRMLTLRSPGQRLHFEFCILHYSTTIKTAPASTDSPSATRTSDTVPAFCDRSSFSIFIASTTTSPCRGLREESVERLDPARERLEGDASLVLAGDEPREHHEPARLDPEVVVPLLERHSAQLVMERRRRVRPYLGVSFSRVTTPCARLSSRLPPGSEVWSSSRSTVHPRWAKNCFKARI